MTQLNERGSGCSEISYLPSGQAMFRWGDGIFREAPESIKPKLDLVQGVEIAPRSLTPSEKGRYRTTGRVLARLIAGRTSDPALLDKLVPPYAPKEVIREASQDLVRLASEGGKPDNLKDKEIIKVSVESYLQTVGVKTVQIRRDVAAIQSGISIHDLNSIKEVEAELRSLNEQFPAIVKLTETGVRIKEQNPNKAVRIVRGQLESKLGQLRAVARGKR